MSVCATAWLIERGFKEGSVLLYYSSTEFKSTLTVYWNRVEAAGMSHSDPVNWEFPFLREGCFQGVYYVNM